MRHGPSGQCAQLPYLYDIQTKARCLLTCGSDFWIIFHHGHINGCASPGTRMPQPLRLTTTRRHLARRSITPLGRMIACCIHLVCAGPDGRFAATPYARLKFLCQASSCHTCNAGLEPAIVRSQSGFLDIPTCALQYFDLVAIRIFQKEKRREFLSLIIQ